MTEHISKKSRTTTFPISNPRTMKGLLNPSNIHDTLPVIQSFLRSINFAFACKYFYEAYKKDLLYSAKDLIEHHVIRYNFPWHSREISKCLKILGIIPFQEPVLREEGVIYEDRANLFILSLMFRIMTIKKRFLPTRQVDLYSYDSDKFINILDIHISNYVHRFYNHLLRNILPEEEIPSGLDVSQIRQLRLNKNIWLDVRVIKFYVFPKEIYAIFPPNTTFNLKKLVRHDFSGDQSIERVNDIKYSNIFNRYYFDREIDFLFELQSTSVLSLKGREDRFNHRIRTIGWNSLTPNQWLDCIDYMLKFNNHRWLIEKIMREHLPILDVLYHLLDHKYMQYTDFAQVICYDKIMDLINRGFLTLEKLLRYSAIYYEPKDKHLLCLIILQILEDDYQNILDEKTSFEDSFEKARNLLEY